MKTSDTFLAIALASQHGILGYPKCMNRIALLAKEDLSQLSMLQSRSVAELVMFRPKRMCEN